MYDNPWPQVYIDRPRFLAVVIHATIGMGATLINDIEGFEASKTDSGDPGTFNFHAPLRTNQNTAKNIAPMDVVALFACRNTFPSALFAPDFLQGLAYADPGGVSVRAFAAIPECIFIGMVDRAEEDFDYESEQPHAILSVNGRDLTKVLIDNDVFVPYTEVIGGDARSVFGQLANIAIPLGALGTGQNGNGYALIKIALDILVKKDPSGITEAGAPYNNPEISAQLAGYAQTVSAAAKYGYPYDSFISLDKIAKTFNPLPNIPLRAVISVQSGSAWINLQEVQNYPVTRMFVNEIGQFIFDYANDAWVSYSPVIEIGPEDVLRCKFSQDDADVVTALSVMPPEIGVGDTQLANGKFLGRAVKADIQAIVRRWGYRWQTFIAQFLGVPKGSEAAVASLASGTPDSTGTATNAITTAVDQAQFWKALWRLHNEYWRCSITVKGKPGYRAGTRVRLNHWGVHPATGPSADSTPTNPIGKVWYVCSVRHVGVFGDHYNTELELRFPQDR